LWSRLGYFDDLLVALYHLRGFGSINQSHSAINIMWAMTASLPLRPYLGRKISVCRIAVHSNLHDVPFADLQRCAGIGGSQAKSFYKHAPEMESRSRFARLRLLHLAAVAGVIWLLFLISLTLGDYITRGWVPLNH